MKTGIYTRNIVLVYRGLREFLVQNIILPGFIRERERHAVNEFIPPAHAPGICSCLPDHSEVNHLQRLSAEQALAHAWIASRAPGQSELSGTRQRQTNVG